MIVSERFFSANKIEGDQVTLAGAEAHHLLHVMRGKVGDRATLFDGSGAEFTAEVVACRRAEVDFRIVERREADSELPFPLTVAAAIPKGDRQKWLVEKLVELGVTRLVPLATERSVAVPSSGALERLERAVIEASKQCGRNRLMEIAAAVPWGEYVKSAGGSPETARPQPPIAYHLFAHPGGRSIAELQLNEPRPTTIAIGPEGGWTDDEAALAIEQGWQTIDLGRRLLRVETAAVALVSHIVLAGGGL
jgi:16S rRNA (uracil1498-N3)-methyltransferase